MKKMVLLILLLPTTVFAQSAFVIKGIGNAFKNGDKIYLFYKAKNINKGVFDSVIVANHTFEFKGNITGFSKGMLYKNENPMLIDVAHDAAEIYIEPGNILITSPDSLPNAVIKGTPINDDYSELYTALRPFYQKKGKITGDFDALDPAQQKDLNTIAAFRANLKKVEREMEPIQFAFIKSHPNSQISLITLNQLVYNSELLPQINEAYKRLTPRAKTSPLGKDLGQIIESLNKSALGIMATNFSLPDSTGKQVSLLDFRGKYVLVDFWASWCLPCRKENPDIAAVYHKYKDKGFTVLGVSIDNLNNKAAWLKAIKDDGLTWPQVLDYKENKYKVKTLYGVTTIPSNVLIDPSGKIVAKNIKDKVLRDKLDELFDKDSQNR